MKTIYFWDIEMYPNYFLAVFKEKGTKNYTIIDIHEADSGELAAFLQHKPRLIGYNSLGYDSQIVEFILRNPGCTVERIKSFNDWLIGEEWPKWRESELSTLNVDMMQVCNYGHRSAKSTSLKKIEFFLRKKNIKDLPYDFNKNLSDSAKPEVIRYCKYDVDITEEFFEKTKDYLKIRLSLNKMVGRDFTNYPEPKLVKKFFNIKLAPKMGLSEEDFKKLRTYRTQISIKDIILPYINFDSDEFNSVKTFYENTVLNANAQNKIILKKQIEYSKEFHGEIFDFGSGGLHQATKPGVYRSDSDYVIQDWDFSSYYPNLAILNNFYPGHLDQNFLDEYYKLYVERQTKYPKKTHYNINYLWKILLNSTYGLSNSEYGPFYDAQYTAQTCINGQLTLAMLVERFAKIPECKILQTNTDGTTIRIPIRHVNLSHQIARSFEKETGLQLEQVDYKKMVIVDVNNYLSVGTDDSIKSKGLFETYDVMVDHKEFHKDPSYNIIPIALENYFTKNIPVHTTIANHNNIHDFCRGVKGKSNFRWLECKIDDEGIVRNEFIDSRMIRYYVGGKSTLYKMWLRNSFKGGKRTQESFTAVEATTPITVCQTIRRSDICRKKKVVKNGKSVEIIDNAFPDLNREWYMQKCYSIIEKII